MLGGDAGGGLLTETDLSGDATIAHLSPARFEAVNPYGLLTFEVARILNRTNRRPLRTL